MLLQHVHSLGRKTIIVTGAARGLGRAMALRFAEDGANIALLGRSGKHPSHPSLASTLEEVADDVKRLGGTPLVLRTDLTQASQIYSSVQACIRTFGGIDVLINNASALYVNEDLSLKQYDTMMNVNCRATFSMIDACLPELKQSAVGHILSISPPLEQCLPKWIERHPPYTLSKFGMTMLTIGQSHRVKSNTLWPQKLIRTAATKRLEKMTNIPAFTHGLSPDHFVEAAHIIVSSDATGECFLDSDLVHVPDGGLYDIFV